MKLRMQKFECIENTRSCKAGEVYDGHILLADRIMIMIESSKDGCEVVRADCFRVIEDRDSIETQPITGDNIKEVLEYNQSLGLEISNIYIDNENRICFSMNHLGCDCKFELEDRYKWLEHIEIDLGKLKPLPKIEAITVNLFESWKNLLIRKINQ